MNRIKQKPLYSSLNKIFPLSWKTCEKCKGQFRWETGWIAEAGPWMKAPWGLTVGRKYHLCKSCASTEGDASNYFFNLSKTFGYKGSWSDLLYSAVILKNEKAQKRLKELHGS